MKREASSIWDRLSMPLETDRLGREYYRSVNKHARLCTDQGLEGVLRPVVKLHNEMKTEVLDASIQYP